MALAAAFDLDVRQYDAVNAFTNAKINRKILCIPPDGFEDNDYLWQLDKALYSLRASPLLWYKELTKTLQELDLKPVPNVNCLYQNDSRKDGQANTSNLRFQSTNCSHPKTRKTWPGFIDMLKLLALLDTLPMPLGPMLQRLIPNSLSSWSIRLIDTFQLLSKLWNI